MGLWNQIITYVTRLVSLQGIKVFYGYDLFALVQIHSTITSVQQANKSYVTMKLLTFWQKKQIFSKKPNWVPAECHMLLSSLIDHCTGSDVQWREYNFFPNRQLLMVDFHTIVIVLYHVNLFYTLTTITGRAQKTYMSK